jgi:hypothetical protein
MKSAHVPSLHRTHGIQSPNSKTAFPLEAAFLNIKGLVAGCHSFCLFFIFYNIHAFILSHSYNTFIRPHSPRPLSISSSLVSSVGKTYLCPVVPSQDSNWGLPYRKLTRYQLSHSAPLAKPRRTIINNLNLVQLHFPTSITS